jgi:hypothetical protein
MKPIVRVPLKYGAIAGTLGALLLIGLYYLGRHPALIHIYLDFRIFVFGIFIFFTLKELRDYFYGGLLYFWQGIIASFLFTVVYAFIASLLIGLFATIVDAYVSDFISQSMEKLALLKPELIEKVGKEAYERNLNALPSTNAADLAFQYFIQCFFIGAFIGIILSVILRRHSKP